LHRGDGDLHAERCSGGGLSYPAITLTSLSNPAHPVPVTNAVSVSGGGDVNPANNSATDVTLVVPGADLTITKTHAGNFTQGQTAATYTVTVTNSGVAPTTATVTVTDTLPLALRPPQRLARAGLHDRHPGSGLQQKRCPGRRARVIRQLRSP
jgi:uncharacterized repeat protein (TIGR01451 family)